MLKLSDVIAQMQAKTAGGKPKAFSLTYVKADRTRKTAGEVRTITHAVLPPQNSRRRKDERMILIQPVGLKKTLIAVHVDLILWFNKQPVA